MKSRSSDEYVDDEVLLFVILETSDVLLRKGEVELREEVSM